MKARIEIHKNLFRDLLSDPLWSKYLVHENNKVFINYKPLKRDHNNTYIPIKEDYLAGYKLRVKLEELSKITPIIEIQPSSTPPTPYYAKHEKQALNCLKSIPEAELVDIFPSWSPGYICIKYRINNTLKLITIKEKS